MLRDLPRYFVDPGDTLLSALKRMDTLSTRLLMVGAPEAFAGVLSIGDIQRHIIRSGGVEGVVREAQRERYTAATPADDRAALQADIDERGIEYMPIVEGGAVVDVLVAELGDGQAADANPHYRPPLAALELPCVIMAGGLGTRMRPLTHVLPKPLLPIGDRPIVEHIMARFERYGVREFFLTVNYRKAWLQLWAEELESPSRVHLVEEPSFLGTGGSLRYVPLGGAREVFVANCDVLADVDYAELHRFHRAHGHVLTAVAFVDLESSPYGTIELDGDGRLLALHEKPDRASFVNAGIYLADAAAVALLPEGEVCHMTDLMRRCLDAGHTVGVFPINRHSWRDLGEWSKYLAAVEAF